MGWPIIDGWGKNYFARVFNDGSQKFRGVSESYIQEAVRTGRAFNINTDEITISADSAVIYVDWQDDESFWIDAIAVGFKDGSATDVQNIYTWRNPTGGTIVDDANTTGLIKSNRNHGSAKTISNDTLIYKPSGSGKTLSGGTKSAMFFQNDQGRLFATVDFLLEKNSSFGITIETDGAFSGAAYVALVGHKVEDFS